jgi:hypothetical protein
VKRDETPREALEVARRSSRSMQEGTLKEIEVHERMNPVSQGSGGRYRRKTITVRRKRRGIGGIELTQQARYDGTNNTLQGSELHERQLRLGDET